MNTRLLQDHLIEIRGVIVKWGKSRVFVSARAARTTAIHRKYQRCRTNRLSYFLKTHSKPPFA